MTGFGVKLMLLVQTGAAGHIHLAADDGVNPFRFTGAVEVNDTVHGAVVGDGAGGLPHLFDQLGQVTDAAGAV